MSDFLNGLKRTDMCGSLRSGDIGRQVTIMGWVVRRRDLGNLIFVQVRDKTGVVQAVFDSSETEKALFDKAFSLRQEYVVAVGGVVRARVGDNVNKNMETGDIEIVADSLKILSEADTPPVCRRRRIGKRSVEIEVPLSRFETRKASGYFEYAF